MKKKGGGYGDHYYRVHVHVPRRVAPEAMNAVETIEAQYAENPRASLKTTL